MSAQDLPPLDADVRALLERARGVAPAPSGAEARVLARVEAIVLPPLPGGGGGGGGGGGAAARAASIGPTQLGVLRRLWPLAATFALGGAVGAGAMRAAVRPPPPVVVDNPRIVVVERAGAAPSAADAPSAAPSASASARAAATGSTSTGAQSGLAAERALLDVARGAIERQDGAAALAATREHERRFPNGMLAQERDAMTVRALVLLGRRDEARARTDRFRSRYPGSVLQPALESQVGSPAASR